MERAKTAEGVTRTQWRKATRKMHGRERQGERRRMRKKQTRGLPSKDKTPYKGGIARRLRMKKKKVGKKATEWQNNGKMSNIWMT